MYDSPPPALQSCQRAGNPPPQPSKCRAGTEGGLLTHINTASAEQNGDINIIIEVVLRRSVWVLLPGH